MGSFRYVSPMNKQNLITLINTVELIQVLLFVVIGDYLRLIRVIECNTYDYSNELGSIYVPYYTNCYTGYLYVDNDPYPRSYTGYVTSFSQTVINASLSAARTCSYNLNSYTVSWIKLIALNFSNLT